MKIEPDKMRDIGVRSGRVPNMKFLVFTFHGGRMYHPSNTFIYNNILRIFSLREALPNMMPRVFIGVHYISMNDRIIV